MKTLVSLVRFAFLRFGLPVALAAWVTACGGGGGTGPVTVPVITNLVITPEAAYVSSSPQTFDSVFDFTDPDGNLASVTVKILDSAGSMVSLETAPVLEVDGLKSGTVLGQLTAVAVKPDTYTVRIYVTNSAGQQSNTLTGTARIVAYPWTRKLAAPTLREHAATAVVNGKLYVMGGQRTDSGVRPGPSTNVLEIYDPVTNTWSTGNPMPTARMGLVATVANGKIYAIGGRTDGFSTSAVGTVELFDPATGLWTTKNPMLTARYFAAGATLPTPLGDQIVVAGGESTDLLLSNVEQYNPLTNAWSSLNAMTTARSQLAMTEFAGRLYAVGGYAGVISQWVNTVEEYDPGTGSWTPRAPMPTARAHLALAPLNGKLLAAGGENVNRSLDVLESYDPAINLWTTKTPSLTAFTRAAAGVVNGKVYVFGNALTLEYDPNNEIR
ncbi:MAG: kelch repeat-containing protein [Polaromonas sp.]|nr:kelch repeat-containing protein [Polaromonas sp.]